jgi:glucokinase
MASEPAGVAVGVDLGGTQVRAAVVDVVTGRILREAKDKVIDRDPPRVAALVQDVVERVDPSGKRAGVGVGFAGMLRGFTGVVANAPNFGWREVDFRSLLRDRLGPSVELYNDLNAIAFGEARYGAARDARDMLCVFVGTGVGGGMVADGRLYIGATHLAGEIGHTKVVSPLDPTARLCGCGMRGCIEAYASGANIARRVVEELGPSSTAAEPRRTSSAIALAGGVERVHAGHLDHAARDGDPYARALWNEIAPMLGMVLANAVTVLNPSRLVLGGGVWEGSPELRRLVVDFYNRMVNAPSGEACVLVDTVLGDTAGVLGAAALIAEGVISPAKNPAAPA